MSSTKCPNCELVNFATATECKRCKLDLASGSPASPPSSRTGSEATFQGNSNSFQRNNSSFGGGAGQSSGARTTTPGLYYEPSGEVTALGLVAGVLGGLTVAVVTGVVYSYIISYIPFVYLNFLCTLGYAIAIGTSVGSLMKWGKVRNTSICIFVAAAVALVSYYVSWAVWLAVTVSGEEFSVSSLTLMQNPAGFWELLLKVNEVGAWSMRGLTFSGIALWAVWAVEALIVLVGSPMMAWAVLTSGLFCESCQMWCNEETKVMSLGLADSGELKRRVEAKDFEFLKSVGPKAESAEMWFRFDLHNCSNCSNTNALSVKIESLKVDSKGNATVGTEAFMDKLLLNATEVGQFRSVSSDLSRVRDKRAPISNSR